MARYLLDTTVLIDHVRGRRTAVQLLEELFREANDLYICDAVVTEALSRGPDEEIAILTLLLSSLGYLMTPPEAASWAGASRRRLGRTSPRTLGDAIIAGVAWFNGATVVTRNPRDFEVQGVAVLAYA